jgi:predicted enzyme related to lactoylglutathione lyase
VRERDKVTFLEAITIKTINPESLAKFYTNVFDLPRPKWHGDSHLGVMTPKIYLGFDRASGVESNSIGRVWLWFQVADLDTYLQRLLGQGATLHMKPHEDIEAKEKYAAVRDPENNVIGLLQPT